MQYTCARCGKHFEHRQPRTYCSQRCANFRQERVTKTCPICQKEFTVLYKLRIQQFCSDRCKGKARPHPKKHPLTAPELLTVLALHPSQAAAAQALGVSIATLRTYRRDLGLPIGRQAPLKLTSDGYYRRGRQLEHRRVAAEMLGRPLRRDEDVHHKDGNRLNNDPANLEVLSHGQHARHHRLNPCH